MEKMDLDDFRSILESAGVDVWLFIDTAITVASLDYAEEFKRRRDGIVERVYAATLDCNRCQNCDANRPLPNGRESKSPVLKQTTPVSARKRAVSPPTPEFTGRDDEDEDIDPYVGLFDDERNKILEIKEKLEHPQQSEDFLVELLQSLADMDITFQALKETDIGRHVNQFRKHSSVDVRRLVKFLVRKWKNKVDEWVKNQPGDEGSSGLMDNGDSPQQRNVHNGNHQVSDFANSPNRRSAGSSGSDRNTSEPEPKPKAMPRKETPIIPTPSNAVSLFPPQCRQREQRNMNYEAEKLASASKRLQESYKEAETAKKQRTIQVMDIHEIPKPKNAFFAKNKVGGDGGSHGRHW